MADVAGAPLMGRAAERAGVLFQYAGAALSVALVLGVGVWGYKIFVRDVTGVPVVRAMEGPMRMAPTDPGGEVTLNLGLAVNTVVARGTAAPPEDVFVLAPVSNGLAPEDMEMASMAEAGEVMPEDLNPSEIALNEAIGPAEVLQASAVEAGAVDPLAADAVVVDPLAAVTDTPMTADQVLALADQIAAGSVPMAPLAADPAALVDDEVAVTEVVAETPIAEAVDATLAALTVDAAAAPATDIVVIPATVAGVAVALRPAVRPSTVSASASSANPVPVEQGPLVSTEVIPVGASLVQLGPFATPELAAAQWDMLNGQFAEFMGGKTRLIQQAESGGQVFYRLRAKGFADLDDARRFCAVLVAENASCIPLVVQ